jgi:hypothetical protein
MKNVFKSFGLILVASLMMSSILSQDTNESQKTDDTNLDALLFNYDKAEYELAHPEKSRRLQANATEDSGEIAAEALPEENFDAIVTLTHEGAAVKNTAANSRRLGETVAIIVNDNAPVEKQPEEPVVERIVAQQVAAARLLQNDVPAATNESHAALDLAAAEKELAKGIQELKDLLEQANTLAQSNNANAGRRLQNEDKKSDDTLEKKLDSLDKVGQINNIHNAINILEDKLIAEAVTIAKVAEAQN